MLATVPPNATATVAAPPGLSNAMVSAAVNVSDCDTLVVDEADRMAESGRFEELSNILGRVYGSVPRAALQTLVFSATLTLPQAQRGRLRAGKGGGGKGGALGAGEGALSIAYIDEETGAEARVLWKAGVRTLAFS